MIGDAIPELLDIAAALDRISGQLQEVEIGVDAVRVRLASVTGEWARLPAIVAAMGRLDGVQLGAREGGPQARQAAEFVRAYIGML